MNRVLAWFSCGATSAVACKLAIQKYGADNVRVIYCNTRSEIDDNMRFLKDCERWYGQNIELAHSEKYHDIWDVFEKTGWLVGPAGARCTTELKKKVRQRIQAEYGAGLIQVFGFDAGEAKRIVKFNENNPEVNLDAILIDRELTKPDCLAIMERVGIKPSMMYELGFPNANCVGCVKASSKPYWRNVKKHFPETFERMAKTERRMDVAITKAVGAITDDNPRGRVFLDELDNYPDDGLDQRVFPECGLWCGMTLDEIMVEDCDD